MKITFSIDWKNNVLGLDYQFTKATHYGFTLKI
jgi:hypothetical protein